MMAHLSAAGTTDAVNAHLLGSGYSSQQSDGLMLAGTDGVQLETTPRGVLESAALQGGGYSSGRQGHSHLQVGGLMERTIYVAHLAQTLHSTIQICQSWLAFQAYKTICEPIQQRQSLAAYAFLQHAGLVHILTYKQCQDLHIDLPTVNCSHFTKTSSTVFCTNP